MIKYYTMAEGSVSGASIKKAYVMYAGVNANEIAVIIRAALKGGTLDNLLHLPLRPHPEDYAKFGK